MMKFIITICLLLLNMGISNAEIKCQNKINKFVFVKKEHRIPSPGKPKGQKIVCLEKTSECPDEITCIPHDINLPPNVKFDCLPKKNKSVQYEVVIDRCSDGTVNVDGSYIEVKDTSTSELEMLIGLIFALSGIMICPGIMLGLLLGFEDTDGYASSRDI